LPQINADGRQINTTKVGPQMNANRLEIAKNTYRGGAGNTRKQFAADER
jgi:hypothetical protein